MGSVPRGRKIFYSVVLIIVVAAGSELGANILYVVLEHKVFPFAAYDEAMRRIASPGEPPAGDDPLVPGERHAGSSAVEVLHPYLGFVQDPNKTPNVSYLGFPQKDDDPLKHEDDGVLTVAVFGGSFAQGVSEEGEAAMLSTLRDRGIDARILTVAMGGYKQPQQLIALASLLSHDARIDVVVNIDGFNEVALPQAELVPFGVDPFYPRGWYFRTLTLKDRISLRTLARVTALEDERVGWAEFMGKIPRYSVIRSLVWQWHDLEIQDRIAKLTEKLGRSESSRAPRFLTNGPNLGIRSEAELYERIAEHWTACSELMMALCASRGTLYLHFLQPNQYYEAGRTLNAEEKTLAYLEDHVYRPGVVKGYPNLLAMKDELLDAHVDFHDLTAIFRDVPQTVYHDDCCHPNQLGYEIVARNVANSIADALTRNAGSRGPGGKIQAAARRINESAPPRRRR